MYGAMFRNGSGAAIIDTEEFTYYAKAEGSARLLTDIGTSPDYQGSFLETVNTWMARGTEACFMRTFWACSSMTHVGEDGVRKKVFRPNPRWERGDLCFWQPGSIGIYWMDEHHCSIDYAPFSGIGTWTAGSSFFCARPSNTVPNWIIASLRRQAVTSAFGLLLRNSQNEITFDSRQNLLAIEHAQIITQAQMADVLDNGATVTITLPRALPNCYISSPIWRSYRRVSQYVNVSTSIYLPLIRQTSSTTLTITRHTVPAENGSNIWASSIDAMDSLAWDGAPGSTSMQAYYFDTPLFVSKGVL